MWRARALLSLGALATVSCVTRDRRALQTELTVDESSANPVLNVVKLLEKMKTQLEADQVSEEKTYNELVCWCETTEREKKMSVADLETQDVELMSQIQEQAAMAASAKTSLAAAENDLSRLQGELNAERAACQKHEDQASSVSAELRTDITNLKNAITVLKKHSSASALQISSPELVSLRAVLREAAVHYGLLSVGRRVQRDAALIALQSLSGDPEDLGERLTRAFANSGTPTSEELPLHVAQRFLEQAAARSPATGFLQGAASPHLRRYEFQSNEIIGILEQMLDDFSRSLSAEQLQAIDQAKRCKALVASKTSEIEAAQAQILALQDQAARADASATEANKSLESARAQQATDKKLLQNLALTCNDADHKWQLRTQTRREELAAIQEAIGILTDDDSRDLFRTTLSFVQLRAHTGAKAVRAKAAATLLRAARAPTLETDDLVAAWNSRSIGDVDALGFRKHLATLAVATQLDSFADVKKMMDKMVAHLKAEHDSDQKERDYCLSAEADMDRESHSLKTQQDDLEAKRAALNSNLQAAIAGLKSATQQISQVQAELKTASETRQDETKAFQTVVADQTAAKDILKKAVLRLKMFYAESRAKTASGGAAGFVQQDPEVPETPVKFETYQKNQGSFSVISLLENIISDCDKEIKEATDAEQSAQTAYESLVQTSNESIANLQEEATVKTDAKASLESDLAQTNSDHADVSNEISHLGSAIKDLHSRCDWFLEHFDFRKQSRQAEIEAIQQAKAILSGMQ